MKEISRLILASGSPRRSNLLRQMGFEFEVRLKAISEFSVTETDPVKRVIHLSKEKAEAVLSEVKSGLIIGADTLVCLEGELFGKPKNLDEARNMLHLLSGMTHDVFTGFTLIETGGHSVSDFEKTRVTFRQLEDWEIEDYIAYGNPLDKAGAYGIQDRSGLFVDRIDGCFYNVVGFPLTKFYEALKKLLDKKTVQKLLNRNIEG
jgi:septum formation protein